MASCAKRGPWMDMLGISGVLVLCVDSCFVLFCAPLYCLVWCGLFYQPLVMTPARMLMKCMSRSNAAQSLAYSFLKSQWNNFFCFATTNPIIR